MKQKVWKSDSGALVSKASIALESLDADAWNSAVTLGRSLDAVVSSAKVKNLQLFSPLRYLLTGVTAGIGVPVIMSILGREITLKRLRNIPQ